MGLMFGRRELLDGLRPYKVAPSSDHSPQRWETGTGNHEGSGGAVRIGFCHFNTLDEVDRVLDELRRLP